MKSGSPKGSGFIQVFNLSGNRDEKTLRKISNDILEGEIYTLKRYPLIQFNENIWFEDPLKDRSWRFWLHVLIMLEYLLSLYEKTNEEIYLEKALFFTMSWKKANFPISNSEMAWHDHSTALRLIIISRLYENLKTSNLLTTSIEQELIELGRFHCEKLMDHEFYMEKHNHGMDQDIALFVAGTVFNTIKEAEDWKSISLKRFWVQLQAIFAPDGSYLEHSPQYSFLLSERLFKFMDFLKKYGNENSYRDLEVLLKRQMEFLMYLLQPDGFIPPIGDSEPHLLNYSEWHHPPHEEMEKLKFIIHGGAEGVMPNQLDKVFPIGGYAVFRNKWEYDEDTVQLVFNSSFHSRVHKHHDDLSFTLFGHKMPLLIDAGKFNYNYDSKERQYVTSIYGHNTVAVDKKNTEIVRLNIGKSGLCDYYLGNEISFVSGAHCLYPGVTHKRLIIYLKPSNFIILDILKGYKEHHFEQIFNFSSKIEVNQNDNEFIGLYEGKNVIKLSPLYDLQNTDIRLAKGIKDPLLGWNSLEHSKIEPNYLGSFIKTGRRAQFATQVSLKPDTSKCINFEWINDLIEITWESNRLEIVLGQDQNYLSLNNKFIKTIPIPQPTLKKAIEEAYQYEYREKYREERKRRIRYQELYEKLNNNNRM